MINYTKGNEIESIEVKFQYEIWFFLQEERPILAHCLKMVFRWVHFSRVLNLLSPQNPFIFHLIANITTFGCFSIFSGRILYIFRLPYQLASEVRRIQLSDCVEDWDLGLWIFYSDSESGTTYINHKWNFPGKPAF